MIVYKEFRMVKATVGAIILKEMNGEKHILLTKRTVEPYKDHWCLPGGHIEPNEKADEAITREVEEETGLHFQGRFYSYFDEIIPERNIHAVVLIFIGTGSGDLKIREEVSEIRWVKIPEALELRLAFQHDIIIKSLLNARPEAGS